MAAATLAAPRAPACSKARPAPGAVANVPMLSRRRPLRHKRVSIRTLANSRGVRRLAPDSSHDPPLSFVHRREVSGGFMRTNAAQIGSVATSAKPGESIEEAAPEG